MADATARFSLDLLQPGQAQKEIFHNESLTLVDALLHPVAQAAGLNDPPASPLPGQSWIVGDAPTGAWSAQSGAIAYWTVGGWRFIEPVPGMLVWVITDGLWALREGSAWTVGTLVASALKINGVQILGGQEASIPDPTGGTVVDAEARMAIAALLGAARAHGLIAT
jgi:hypothetical protein